MADHVKAKAEAEAKADPSPEAKAEAEAQAAPEATAEVQPPRTQLDEKLDTLRGSIADKIDLYFPMLFWVTLGVALFLIVLAGCGFFMDKTMDATVLAASVQVAFGMIMGFVCVYLGLMMTWFGLESAYSLKGSMGNDAGKVEGALKSSSPGLLFALAGIVLIGVSLHKRIEFQEDTSHYADDAPVDPKAPTFFNVRPDDSEPQS